MAESKTTTVVKIAGGIRFAALASSPIAVIQSRDSYAAERVRKAL
jgi:hypothetical protein